MSNNLPSAAAHLERLFDDNAPANVRFDSLTVLLSNHINIPQEARTLNLSFRALPKTQELAYCPAELASIIAFTIDPAALTEALAQRTDIEKLKVSLSILPHLAESQHVCVRTTASAMETFINRLSGLEPDVEKELADVAQEKHALYLARALKARTIESREAYCVQKLKESNQHDLPSDASDSIRNNVPLSWFAESCLNAIVQGIKREAQVDKHLKLWRKWKLGSAEELASKILGLIEDSTQTHGVKQAAVAALEFMHKDYATPMYLSRPEEELVMFVHQLHKQDVPSHVADDKQAREFGTKNDVAIIASALEKSRASVK